MLLIAMAMAEAVAATMRMDILRTIVRCLLLACKVRLENTNLKCGMIFEDGAYRWASYGFVHVVGKH